MKKDTLKRVVAFLLLGALLLGLLPLAVLAAEAEDVTVRQTVYKEGMASVHPCPVPWIPMA